MKLITILVLTTFLSGCVGIAVLGTVNETYGPNVEFKGGTKKQIIKSTSPREISKEDVISEWGQPYEKVKDGDLERWIYKHDLLWTGIMPLIIIPIPLVIPTGYYRASLTFTGNKLTDSEQVIKTWSGFFCGISPFDLQAGCYAK